MRRGPKLNTTPLNERVCKRGHVGQYRLRADSSVACYECSKIALVKFKERGGASYPVGPLEERVCSRGHVGQYQLNSKGHARCTECQRIAMRAYQDRERGRSREVLNLARLTKRREYLTSELAELMLRIALEESIIKQREERE